MMDEKKPNPWTRSLMIWAALLFGLVLVVQATGGGSAKAGEPITYSQFVKAVDQGEVKSVTIATASGGNSAIAGTMEGKKAFTTPAPFGGHLLLKVVEKFPGRRLR